MANILKALNETTDASGGFTVPDQLAASVLALIQAQSVTIPDMENVSGMMQSDTLLLPKLTAGSTARWITEDAAITGADVGFGRTTLSACKVAALMTASTELLEDSAVAIAGIITNQFGKDLALAIDSEILTGTTSGRITGLTSGAGNTYSAGTLGYSDLIEAQSLNLEDNQVFPTRMYSHPVDIKKLKLLTDGNGRPIFDEITFGSPLLRDGVIGTVLGMGIKTTTQLTSSTMIIGSPGDMGYYAQRRRLGMNKFYNIGTDDWVYQANMRVAFAVKYANSICVITNVS